MDNRELNILIIDCYGNTTQICMDHKEYIEFAKKYKIDDYKIKRHKGKRDLHNTVNQFIKDINNKRRS